MKKKQLILGLLLVVLVGLGVYAQHKHPVDWPAVWTQFAKADWTRVALGTACILIAYVFRSIRWAYLLRHNKRVPLFSLLGTQVIGFTAVALIGRVADPVRPYLVSKKTGLPISNQIAVYIVERLFDAGSMALIFSSTILLSTWFGDVGSLPHPERIQRAGLIGLAATVAGALFLVAVRFAGGAVAAFFEATLGVLSKKIGETVGNKIREFRTGLDAMRSFGDFAVAAGLSIGMWLLISAAYFAAMRAFVADPVLAAISPAKCVLMMVVSGVSSSIQLPVIGWFSQIGLVAAAITSFLGVAQESAVACAVTLLLVTFLCVVPLGLVWAQFEHVSLRKVTEESEHVDEALTPSGSAE